MIEWQEKSKEFAKQGNNYKIWANYVILTPNLLRSYSEPTPKFIKKESRMRFQMEGSSEMFIW